MAIASDDWAPIITAALAGLATLVTAVTSLFLAIRNNKRLDKHEGEIKELKSNSGVHKILPDTPSSGV